MPAGGKGSFGELFERGVLRSDDWPKVREKVSKYRDGDGKLVARIHG